MNKLDLYLGVHSTNCQYYPHEAMPAALILVHKKGKSIVHSLTQLSFNIDIYFNVPQY